MSQSYPAIARGEIEQFVCDTTAYLKVYGAFKEGDAVYLHPVDYEKSRYAVDKAVTDSNHAYMDRSFLGEEPQIYTDEAEQQLGTLTAKDPMLSTFDKLKTSCASREAMQWAGVAVLAVMIGALGYQVKQHDANTAGRSPSPKANCPSAAQYSFLVGGSVYDSKICFTLPSSQFSYSPSNTHLLNPMELPLVNPTSTTQYSNGGALGPAQTLAPPGK